MPKFCHSDVLDQGINLIRTAGVRLQLLSQYTAGDSYATVQGNKLCESVVSSADMGLSSSGSSRVLTLAAGKTATLTVAATGTDSHIAVTDGSARVLWVTDETTNPSGPIGSTVTFPALTCTVTQPV